MIKLINFENSIVGKDINISNPTWDIIEKHIRLLNGKNHSYLCLYEDDYPNPDLFFLIGGGDKGIYTCSFYNKEEYYLVNPIYKNDNSIENIVVGEKSSKLKKQCVTLEQVLRATNHYFYKDTIKGFPNWEKY